MEETPMYLRIINILSIVIAAALHISIYMWIEKLEREKCECSKLWHRDVVKILAIVLFVIVVINTYMFSRTGFDSKKAIRDSMKNPYITYMYWPISLVVGVSYIGIMFDYIYKLKELECECSEDWKREFGWYYSIFSLTLWGLLILLILINMFLSLVVMFSIIYSKKK